MKFYLCILIVSFALMQGAVAKHGRNHHFTAEKCCKVENSTERVEMYNKGKEIFEACAEEVSAANQEEPTTEQSTEQSEEQKKKRHGHFACIMECAAKKFKIINEENKVDPEGVKSHVDELAKLDDYKKAIADEVVKECSSVTERSGGPDGAKKCPKTPMKVLMCINRKLFLSCPAEKRDSSEECTKFFEMVEKGPRTKEAQDGNESATEGQ
ncbi:uncharacterized protein LOC116337057 [Contarinia nasturtii]|uniref:uncharacterized protein LOC116337057 n=1 Tax=Contarinia nasturtii TaxID=265458 RepID=UPI0012D40934|nr:uncharacterized protein LOC116337057 [Contarinia nasturtii]